MVPDEAGTVAILQSSLVINLNNEYIFNVKWLLELFIYSALFSGGNKVSFQFKRKEYVCSDSAPHFAFLCETTKEDTGDARVAHWSNAVIGITDIQFYLHSLISWVLSHRKYW